MSGKSRDLLPQADAEPVLFAVCLLRAILGWKVSTTLWFGYVVAFEQMQGEKRRVLPLQVFENCLKAGRLAFCPDKSFCALVAVYKKE